MKKGFDQVDVRTSRMISIEYAELPQPIKSQYKQKRFEWALRNGDGAYLVKAGRDVHRWIHYERHGWKKEKVRV